MDKRRTLLAVVLFILVLLLGTGMAKALVIQSFERGCVVPYATYNAAGVDTVVGISVKVPTLGHGIYWSFYNANGVPLMSNSIPIGTANQYSLSLANGDGGAHSGQIGWLLITWDDNGVLDPGEPGHNIAGNAFLVNMTTKDAAFLPVVPLGIADYDPAAPITLLNPPNSPLITMWNGQSIPNTKYLESRFLVSTSGDPRTTLVIFTPLDVPVQLDASVVSTTGAFQEGITINTTNHKLNVFYVESIVPPGFTEGVIDILNPATSPIGIQFSLIYWSVVGAEQTIISNELF